MARIAEKRGNRHAFAAAFIAVAVVALVAAGFTVITLEPAVASHDVDNSTLGIGEARNTVSDDEAFASSEGDSNAQERFEFAYENRVARHYGERPRSGYRACCI